MKPNTADRQSLRVWLLLAILGAILSVVGWYRVFTVVLVAQDTMPPAFEVASVKPNNSGTTRRGGGPQPGRFVQTNVTLRQLIQMAYSQQAFDRREIAGGPDWIDSERFDIEAKIDDGLAGNLGRLYLPDGKGSPGLAYLMVRTLLAERFKLVVHDETRERPVYALVMARDDRRMGSQLRRSAVDCDAVMAAIAANGRPPGPPKTGGAPPCSMGGGPGRLMGSALTMPQIANGLSPYVNRVVRDRTGIAGNFDLDLAWTPAPGEYGGIGPFDHNAPPTAEATSIFTALQEQLGLRLEATTGPVDVLVVDRAERPSVD
jgi:uncharacterized protein (TIGR03435 family)